MRILRGCKSLQSQPDWLFCSGMTHANPSVASAEEGAEDVSASMGETPGHGTNMNKQTHPGPTGLTIGSLEEISKSVFQAIPCEK